MAGISNTNRTLNADRDKLGRFVIGSKGHEMPHTKKTKIKISIAHKGKRMSPKTEFKKGLIPWNKGLISTQKPYWLGKKRLGMMGDKNPAWKGGITSFQAKIRNSVSMINWRKAVFQKDNHTCVLCRQIGGRLQADHIYPFSRMLEESNLDFDEIINNKWFWDISNGRTLCFDCHKKVKNIGGLRMAGITPTQRTIKYLREKDWTCDVVERWLKNPKHPAGGFRKDMFGFGDIVAMGEGSIIAIQSCGQAFSEHNRKITEDEKVAENALLWIENGGRLILIGWRKVKLKKGGKAMRWSPRIKEFEIKDFTGKEKSK